MLICFAKPGKEDYFNLYKATPWFKEYNLNIDTLYKSLENSFIMVTAYDNDALVGFGRIISDGIIHAYIVDVIIHPNYRGMGYGKYIRNELINKCKSFNIPDIQIIENNYSTHFSNKSKISTRQESIATIIHHVS